MRSTGNDIIALNAINIARTVQPRFYSKILSASEKELYNNPAFSEIPFENFVWLLWSVKEAAYKYLQRINPGLVFSPTKFVVKQLTLPVDKTLTNFKATQKEGVGFEDTSYYKGYIIYEDNTLYFASIIYQELMHTVVNSGESFKNIYWGIKLIENIGPENQSAEVRDFLIKKLKFIFNTDAIRIEKSTHGYPVLLKENIESAIPVSLAHHHNWVAYSFQQ
jgi:phosphopantetheinyl transferase (holo-ACP synthase)